MAALNVLCGAVALLCLLCCVSNTSRYYAKFVVFVVLSLVFATLPVPLMLFRPRDPRNALLPARLLRLAARWLGLRWQVRGAHHIDNSRGAVVLLNHQTSLDLFVLAVLWPMMARCTVVSKKALLYLVPFGPACWLWGTVFIDRTSGQQARDSVNKQAEAVRNNKAKLLLFPEGTRHAGATLLPFRKGAFHAALDARAPIQPVVVSKYHFLDAKAKRFDRGELIITILPLIETRDMTKEDIPRLMETTRDLMQHTFTASSDETRDARA